MRINLIVSLLAAVFMAPALAGPMRRRQAILSRSHPETSKVADALRKFRKFFSTAG